MRKPLDHKKKDHDVLSNDQSISNTTNNLFETKRIPKEVNFSVFYSAGRNTFFQSRTDFPDLQYAQAFIDSELFTKHDFKFDFMLKDGKELISGKPLNNSQEYFEQAMKYAVEIPLEEYL